MIDTAQLHILLTRTLEHTSAAECHGALTGLACGYGNHADPDWAQAVSMDESGKAHEILWALGEETRRALNDQALGFAPVLPDDDQSIAVRANALCLWCRGFLYGFGLTAAHSEASEINEILHDFADIAREEFDTEGDEEDEAVYSEIVEYLRVSVQLIFETLQPAPAPSNATLH